MKPFLRRALRNVMLANAIGGVWATEIQWTRMTGQWPVEASPLVGSFGNSGTNILILNQGGQLLLWTGDGAPLGGGQDGMVAQLPAGRWTTQPIPVGVGPDAELVVASVKGEVVCLDKSFLQKWQHKLEGETVWGRALPAILKTAAGDELVFSDSSGLLTCLTLAGELAWTNALGAGPCKAPPKAISLKDGNDLVLAPAGPVLVCCDSAGKEKWRRDLGSEIVTRPEDLALAGQRLLLCGTATGTLFALDFNGKIVWEVPIGEPFSAWLTFLPRPQKEPLIVFTGLWGNLHAVDARGHRVWTHLFRSKTRAVPLALDIQRKGRFQVFVPAFNQHVYAFDEQGQLTDDIRLSGILPSGLTAIAGTASGGSDLLATTTTLLAYRLRPGPARSPYGPLPAPQNVSVEFVDTEDAAQPAPIVVKNPSGGLIHAQVSFKETQGWTKIMGTVTARSVFEVPLEGLVSTNGGSIRVTVQDSLENLISEKTWSAPPRSNETAKPPSGKLTARATAPYGAFDEADYASAIGETTNAGLPHLAVEKLYLDEIDQAAFVLTSGLDEPVRARVSLGRLAREDGVVFSGTTVVREVVPVGSVNGEKVPDALPALGEAGLISLEPHRLAKVWISVDAHHAQSGIYTGQVVIASLQAGVKRLEIPFKVEVVNLRLPKEFPLRLCTWDYVPNRWFSSRTTEVLDDMGRHGVNIFPRTTIPPGRVDTEGKLVIDWKPLDAELQRLEGRGKILFQLGHPPIEFPANRIAAQKHATELEYIRDFRDHLKERGRDYPDYAIYLLDEPGLDYGTNVAVLLDVGVLIREADPKMLTYTDPVPGLSWKDLERIEPLVDVWAPNMRLVSGLLSGDPRIKRIMNAKTVWSYECVAQVKSLSPLRYNRANAWRAKFFGLSGIGFWTHSTTDVDHWFAGKGENDEFALVYPGELPVPSVRWEAVRDGLEDTAAIAALQDEIRRNRVKGTRPELVQQAEGEIRIALTDVMELSDQAFVESRDFLRKGDRVLWHTGTDVEMFRHHRAEIARLTLALLAEE